MQLPSNVKHMSDIEDFPTDELRREIHRREQAAREKRCWYCNKNIDAHTCKYAQTSSPVPGWEVKPPRWVFTEDCMGQALSYWQVDARHPVLGMHTAGLADTADEATQKCVTHIQQIEATWASTSQV